MENRLKKIFFEVILIGVASLVLAVAVNFSRGEGLRLLDVYQPGDNPASLPEMEVPPVDLETLKAFKDSGMVLLVDARDEESFRNGHIPGAVNLPLRTREESFELLRERLSSGITVVTYCVDPGCRDSTFLATWLAERGITDIMVYTGGIEGWISAGLVVETDQGGRR